MDARAEMLRTMDDWEYWRIDLFAKWLQQYANNLEGK